MLSNSERTKFIRLVDAMQSALRAIEADTTSSDPCQRATNRADRLMSAYGFHMGSDGDPVGDEQEMLTDVLTDLMHWASSRHASFDTSLRIARSHHDIERTGGMFPGVKP